MALPRTGTWLYRTPDGSEIEVTHVTNSFEHEILWPDLQYMGVVDIEKGYKNESPTRGTFDVYFKTISFDI
jgi:hypothetical protein